MISINEGDFKFLALLVAVYIAGILTGLVNNDVTVNLRSLLIPSSIVLIIGIVVFMKKDGHKKVREAPVKDYSDFRPRR